MSRRSFLQRIYKTIHYYFPFTAAGTVYVSVSVYLLGTAFASGNVYAFLFSISSMVLLIILAFLARLQAFRMGSVQISWDSGNPLIARKIGGDQVLHLGEDSPLYFFRIHFVLKGILHAGRKAPLYYYREASASAGSHVSIPFSFPVSGRLDVGGHAVLHDIFGFVRARIGNAERRTLYVRPPVFSMKIPPRFENSFSLESSRNRRSSDEEKYYMREYMPGDRMKDINWKSSSRIAKLITRISPASPEQSKVIQILFRTGNPNPNDSLESVMHLNFIKSWLLSFIISLQGEGGDSFRFVVTTPEGSFEVDDPGDLDALSVRLSSIPYSNHEFDIPWEGIAHEVIVFATGYDRDLPHYIASHPGVNFRVFQTVRGKGKQSRKISFFRQFDPTLFPGLWILRRQKPTAAGINDTGARKEKLSVSF
ncbi:MAG: DUF58 domain-containing protein [Spirochaetia bacterium]|nr:DUF58 domain-containing protein [Spirochaetia bacterium]